MLAESPRKRSYAKSRGLIVSVEIPAARTLVLRLLWTKSSGFLDALNLLDVLNLVDFVLDIAARGLDHDHVALFLADQGTGDG